VLLNTYSGAAKIFGFWNGWSGSKALAHAELDLAYSRLRSALAWQPGNEVYRVIVGRVIHTAQSNGVPLEALEGHQPTDVLGVGVDAVTSGIAMNPADAWAWFNLAEVYGGFRFARIRLDRMRRAGEAAASGAPEQVDPPEPAGVGLDPEDRIAAAATMKALELEPEFFFYHDFLAKLYWDRGLKEAAGREIRESFALMPRVEVHPLRDDHKIVEELADPILEGIDRAALNPSLDPSLALQARAGVLELLGRSREAIAAYQALALRDASAHVIECDLNIGRLRQHLGEFRESIPFLERVTARDAGGGAGTAAIYFLAQAHSRLSDHQQAVAYLKKYLALAPGSLHAYLRLGEELEEAGSPVEAEQILVTAVRKFPDEPVAYERVIASLVRHEKLEEAQLYAEALRHKDAANKTAEGLLRRLNENTGRKGP
jgi:tetratricopeptide (TPR) repeat protein